MLDNDLRRIFSGDSRDRSRETASSFLRRIGREIEPAIAEGTGVHAYTVAHLLDLMIERAGHLKLRRNGSQLQTKQHVMIMLTAQTVNVVHTGYHRIPL